jgi:hypothetical protein
VPGLVYATGHYRNGALLAPSRPRFVGDLIEGRETSPSLDAFSPDSVSGSTDMSLLGTHEVAHQLATLPGWTLAGNAIRKQFTFAGFPEAIAISAAAGSGSARRWTITGHHGQLPAGDAVV